MNSKLKIAAGIFAGLIAGSTLMGTAIAAPRAFAPTAPYGTTRQTASTDTTLGAPSWSEMRSFMNQYRNANGTIDRSRMHRDVTSGKVTPPCLTRKATSTTQTGQTAPSTRRGPSMMSGWTTSGSTGGYNMMGRTN